MPSIKPVPRTSHSCTIYKNRYLIIIGGETDTAWFEKESLS